MGGVDLKILQKTTSAQLDLNPVVVALHAGTAGLPAIAGVHSSSRENDVSGLSITIVASLDHSATVGQRGKVKDSLFLGEDWRYVAIHAKTSLFGALGKSRSTLV